VSSGNSGWDIVFPTDYIVKPMLANDLVAPIQRERLTNLDQLERVSETEAGIRSCGGRYRTWLLPQASATTRN